MAKALLACFRNRGAPSFTDFARALCARLALGTVAAAAPWIREADGVGACVFNPAGNVWRGATGIRLGVTEGVSAGVLEPGAPAPAGTFALFRAAPADIELVADTTASRTIWYVYTPAVFAASSSQRMLVSLLGDFIRDARPVRWMLAAGVLGPGLSWDARLRAVPPGGRVRLHRPSWTLTTHDGPTLEFAPAPGARAEHRARLAAAVERAVQQADLSAVSCVLALSGGMDSRSLLHHLRRLPGLRTVTWGLGAAREQMGSDAAIAAFLAQSCGLPHQFAATDVAPGSFPRTFQRFVAAGEGRIDHLSGYMDGLALWARLAADYACVIRGYDAFGWKPRVASEQQARRVNGMVMTADGPDLLVPSGMALTERDIPATLRRRRGESLLGWRDRLWLEYRTPVVTAALDDVKTAYVEIANPLLSREVVDVVRALPEELRTEKALFREIVTPMFPGVPFARSTATEPLDGLLARDDIAAALVRILADGRGTGVLPDEFLSSVVAAASRPAPAPTPGDRLVRMLRPRLPAAVKDPLRPWLLRRPTPPRRLALRAAICIAVDRLLRADASAGAASALTATRHP